jgi:hypothetical protein
MPHEWGIKWPNGKPIHMLVLLIGFTVLNDFFLGDVPNQQGPSHKEKGS